MGYYNSYSASSGTAQTICSPVYSRAAIPSGTVDSVSFWMYRDDGYSYDDDEITVSINTTASLSGATALGTVVRYTGSSTPYSVTSDGWYYFSFAVPSGFTGGTNYLLVTATSEFGNNMFIDDISWTSYPPACSGTPTVGTISGPSSVCPSSGYALNLTGDSLASGITYQWYSSPSGAGTFTAISGATTASYSASSLSAATDFEVVATCGSSALTDTTPIYTISVTPFYTCYCSPTTGTTLDYSTYYSPIDSFAIQGTTLANGTPGSSSVYTQYVPVTSTTTGTMSQGSLYTAYINSAGGYSGYGYNAYMWIDFDHSGTFDAGEFYTIASDATYATTASGSFMIPSSADTGITGLRVRCTYQYSTAGGGDACTEIYYGTTEDYLVTIAAGVPCTGSPSAGTAFGNQTSVCSSGSFNLYDTAYATGLGISYQWYSRPSGSGTYAALYGGTGVSVTGVTQSSATDYVLVVTCDSSGTSDTSNVVTIGMSPFYLCYCSPLTGTTLDYAAYYSAIDSFSISGTTLANHTPGSSAVYTQFYPVTSTTTATLNQGSTYTAFLRSISTYTYYNYNAYMWIDYDHSGTFDGSEFFTIASSAAPGSTSSSTFTVSGSSDTGITGLRVRCTYQYSTAGSGDACTEIYDGVTDDYLITIAPGVPCSGTPAAGTAISSVATVCSTGSFNLADTGYSNGLGLTYQWYSSPAGAGTYSALYGGSSSSVTGVTQTSATDYIFVATCDSSGLSDTSNVLTVGMSTFYLCYCSPNTGTTLDYSAYYSPIDSFAIAGTTLNNPTPGSSAVYTDYYPVTSSTTGTVNQGNTYSVYLQSDGGYSGYSYNAYMWIDYDHSGTFDASEFYTIASPAPWNSVSSTSFIVPGTADTGTTGLRVRCTYQYGTLGSGDACTESYDGVTQDYLINIAPGVPCTGTPTAGTPIASMTTVCSTGSFNLTDTGFSNGLGITYQWYSSPSGAGTYSALYGGGSTSVSGVTQSSATDYIFVATCDSSGLSDTSAVLTVNMSPFYLCYCSPLVGTTLDYSAYYSEITAFSIAGTTLNNTVPSGSTILYTQYWPTTPSTTASMAQATSHTATVNSSSYYTFYNYNAYMWIDYDHSGTFDATEFTVLGSNVAPGTATSAVFNIPPTADTGATGLRVRATYEYSTAGSGDACTEIYDGSTQDYVINITPGVPCSGTPTAGAAYAVASVCESTPLTLTDTGYTMGLDLTYQWISSPSGAGTYTAISGATSYTYTYNQTAATDYRFVVTCTASGFADTSAVITVNENSFLVCYCNDGTLDSYTGYSQMDSVSILGTTLSVYNSSSTPYIAMYPSTGLPTGDSTTTLTQASTYTFDVNANTLYGYTYNSAAWIDYNQDGTFEASEYVAIASSASSGTSSTASFTVPLSADTGYTGMRVRTTYQYSPMTASDACTDFYEGQTFDFKINITAAPACAGLPTGGVASATGSACDTTTITLSDLAAATSTGLTFQWQSSADGISWSNIPGATTDPYSFSGMTATTYYRMFVTCTASGLTDSSNSFSVISTPCYCTTPLWAFASYGTNPTSYAMSQFSATGGYGGTSISDATIIGDTNPADGYTDHTSLTPMEMQQGGSYPITVTYNNNSYGWENQVWIDFGDNGFDAIDTVTPAFGVAPYGTSTSSNSSTINIPAGATPGYHRMRVRNTWMQWSSYIAFSDPMDPCAESDPNVTYGDGDVVDYTVYIVPTYCDSVVGITASPVTATTATITWDTVSGSAGYQYTVDTTATAPTAGGTATLGTTASLTGLIPGTTYYVHVRNSCGPGDFSVWETISFTTNCDTVTGLTVSTISATSATITWSPVAGSTTYDYVFDNTATAPAGSGTATTATTATTAITAGVLYYAHVRNSCPGGGFSPWVTIPVEFVCDTVSAASISISANDTGVIFSYPAVSGGYYYTVDGSPAAPTSGGTFTTGTTDTVTGLTPGGSYYIHISTACGSGTSAWTTVPFNTTICDSVTGLTVTSSDTGLVFTFTAATGSLGYYYTVDNSPAAPATGGTFTTATTDTVTGLTPGTVYFVHVRSSCGGGYSTWTATAASTYACDTVTVSAFANDTFAYITWTGAPGAAGYQYIIDSSSATPSGAGITTTSTADTITSGLVAGTVYYAHVRVNCGGGNYSAWVTVPFTLSPCDTTIPTVLVDSPTFATIGWIFQAGAGYNYALDNTPGAPTSGITYVPAPDTTASFSSLLPNTLYYFHIQVVCGYGSGLSSGWITISFTTPPPAAVSTVNKAEFAVKAFPNPAVNMVTVKVTGAMGANGTVQLTDVTGKILKQVAMQADQVDVDMSDVAAGIYLIKYTDDTHTQVIKINKQ
jgi:hypothetical protein